MNTSSHTTQDRPARGDVPGAASQRRAAGLLASSILARLPQAMVGLALLVHVHRVTGSFAIAGVASGAYAIARGAGAPLLGRLVDGFGQTLTLTSTAAGSALALVAIAVLPPRPLAAVVLAAAIGLMTPPVGACARALLPDVVDDPKALPKAYMLESAALELTFIFGPPLALGVGSLWSTGAALALGGVVQLAATAAFALQPASRNWRPSADRPAARNWRPLPDRPPARGGSLRSPAMRTLVLVLVAVGAIFGAVDVAVTAAASALGDTAAAGPLLGVWGLGSLLGGIVATRLGGAARGVRGLAALVAALAVGHGLLLPSSGSLPAIAAVLLFAGAWIAPTTGAIYEMVGRCAPAGSVTEAFGWITTANCTGASVGAAVGGSLTASLGAPGAFALAGVAGALAVAIITLRAGTLACDEPEAVESLAAAVA
jgi:hypothetical protein